MRSWYDDTPTELTSLYPNNKNKFQWLPSYNSSRNISEDGSNTERRVFVYRSLGNQSYCHGNLNSQWLLSTQSCAFWDAFIRAPWDILVGYQSLKFCESPFVTMLTLVTTGYQSVALQLPQTISKVVYTALPTRGCLSTGCSLVTLSIRFAGNPANFFYPCKNKTTDFDNQEFYQFGKCFWKSKFFIIFFQYIIFVLLLLCFSYHTFVCLSFSHVSWW